MTALLKNTNLDLLDKITARKKEVRTMTATPQEANRKLRSRFVKNNHNNNYIDLTRGVDSVTPYNSIRAKLEESYNFNTKEGAEQLKAALSQLNDPFSPYGLTTVFGVKYAPLEDLVYMDASDDAFLNGWTDPLISPIEPTADEEAMLNDYFSFLVKDKTERSELLKWLAHVALKPDKKTQVALLLYGASNGTGKSTLASMLAEIVGHQNSFLPDNSADFITGTFKDDLANKSLVVLEEIYHKGNDPYKVANAMKQYTTEEHLSLNVKHEKRISVINHTNWIGTSNNLVPIGIQKDDRRWLCFRIEWSDKDLEQVTIKGFARWVNSNKKHSAKVFKNYLEQVDISDYRPYESDAYFTKAKAELIEDSVSVHETEAQNLLDNFTEPTITLKHFQALYKDEMHKGIGSGKAKEYMLNAGYEAFENTEIRINGTKQRSLWITTKGIEAGLLPHMDGAQASKILKEESESITDFCEWDDDL